MSGPKPKDLTNQRFGELIAIRQTNKKCNGSYIWECLCSCGKIKEISSHSLTRETHSTKTCGSTCHLVKDISGYTIGELTVLKRMDIKNTNGSYSYLCRCSCGKTILVNSNNLINRKKYATKSCGHEKDLTGKIFGRWTVLDKSNKTDKWKYTYWNCACSCGNIGTISTTALLQGKSRSCGCLTAEHFAKYSIFKVKSYRISKGKDPNKPMTQEQKLLRTKLRDLGILKEILARDKFTCQLCYKQDHKLNVHHIIPVNIDSNLASDKSNLITLCRYCHKTLAHNNNWHKTNYYIQRYLQSIIHDTCINIIL